MKKFFLVGLMIAGAFIFGGCATLFNGKPQNIAFDSKPQGASVKTAEGITYCQTPCSIPIERSSKKTLLFSKDGYETVSRTMTTTINGAVWFDVLATSPLSTTVDIVTAKAYTYKPDSYFIELSPVGASSTSTPAPTQAPASH